MNGLPLRCQITSMLFWTGDDPAKIFGEHLGKTAILQFGFQIRPHDGQIWREMTAIKRQTGQMERPRQGHRGLIMKVAKLQSVTGRETRKGREKM